MSINLPQIGIIANGDEEVFWKLLDERLEICYEALMFRHKQLRNIISDNSPIHWQYGAIARLPKGASIEPLLYGSYSSISLGYIGLYETCIAMKGVSNTDPVGKEFAMRVEGGSVTNLYFEKLKNIEVSFPKKEEQEKIARFFEEIDNLITLHQRKLEKLINIKKAYLNEMFV